jgi:hypothetical protein
MNIKQTIREATPWNRTLATLASCEERIGDNEKGAMLARWEFGRELVRVRVEYKGRLVVPKDLMKLVMEKYGKGKSEIKYRIQLAERFETKKLLADAVGQYGSWRRMQKEGLVTKKQPKTAKRKKPTTAQARPFLLRRLQKETEAAYAHHPELTREEVTTIEALVKTLTAVLDQIDRNDAMQAKRVSA